MSEYQILGLFLGLFLWWFVGVACCVSWWRNGLDVHLGTLIFFMTFAWFVGPLIWFVGILSGIVVFERKRK